MLYVDWRPSLCRARLRSPAHLSCHHGDEETGPYLGPYGTSDLPRCLYLHATLQPARDQSGYRIEHAYGTCTARDAYS